MEEKSIGNTSIVFGTGICLQNNWRLIKKHFAPQYFSDNAEEKWHTFPMGDETECIPPEKIKDMADPQVLIAIGDPYIVDAVKAQMADLGVPCEAITDLLEAWGEKEMLPEHLARMEYSEAGDRMWLFNSPEHDNVGDHLISVAELEFIRKNFPGYELIEVTDIEYLWFRQRIRRCVRPGDMIVVTGGGFLGSMWLYNGELNVRGIIEDYPDHQIIIMPQTAYFERNARGQTELQRTVEIYGRHKDLTICLRDRGSYELLKVLLGERVRVRYFPDMALSLNYSSDRQARKGALLCLRKDKESVMEEEQKNEIREILEGLGIGYKYTLMHTGRAFQMDEREREIELKALQMKSAELVVTDTLHCMILCAITGTPCLAFDNLSAKVSGVYAWIEKIPYIHLYKQGENVDTDIRRLLDCGPGQYHEEALAAYYAELAGMMRRKKDQGWQKHCD